MMDGPLANEKPAAHGQVDNRGAGRITHERPIDIGRSDDERRGWVYGGVLTSRRRQISGADASNV